MWEEDVGGRMEEGGGRRMRVRFAGFRVDDVVFARERQGHAAHHEDAHTHACMRTSHRITHHVTPHTAVTKHTARTTIASQSHNTQHTHNNHATITQTRKRFITHETNTNSPETYASDGGSTLSGDTDGPWYHIVFVRQYRASHSAHVRLYTWHRSVSDFS
eukprot:2107323-Rhodomonas_salina.1